jgi:hypothetical protein
VTFLEPDLKARERLLADPVAGALLAYLREITYKSDWCTTKHLVFKIARDRVVKLSGAVKFSAAYVHEKTTEEAKKLERPVRLALGALEAEGLVDRARHCEFRGNVWRAT